MEKDFVCKKNLLQISLTHLFFYINSCICQFRPENITKKSRITILSKHIESSDIKLAIKDQT